MKIVNQNDPLFSALSPQVALLYPSISIFTAETLPLNSSKALGVSQGLSSKELVSLFLEKQAQHWVQKNDLWFENDLLQAGQFCEQQTQFFSECGIRLKDNELASHSISFSAKEDKPRLKEEVSKFVLPAQSQNASDSAEIIAEELYMNAMFDAPREAEKLGFKNCKYTGDLKAKLELRLYSDRLIMTMIDPFGSLDCWKFIQRMDQVYQMGAGEVLNRGPGGAGLGCVIIFENCSSLFLGVNRQKQTQVSCVIPIGFSNRQRDKIFKSLHRIEICTG